MWSPPFGASLSMGPFHLSFRLPDGTILPFLYPFIFFYITIYPIKRCLINKLVAFKKKKKQISKRIIEND